MASGKENSKKKVPVWLIVILAVMFLFSVMDGEAEDVIFTIIGLAFLLAPVIIVIAIIVAVRKNRAKNEEHSHDRVDHSGDLKIDRQTGRVENRPVRYAAQHSAKEHWKQQLDGLLANGTIDRAEYNAMLKRRF